MNLPADLDPVADLPTRIHECLDEGALAGRDRIAFIDEAGKKWSYADVIAAREKMAAELTELGIRPGDRLMLVCENSIAAITAVFAASTLDAIVAIINARLSSREIDAIRDDCMPRRVIYTDLVSANAAEHGERHGASSVDFGAIGTLKVSELNTECTPSEVFPDNERQVAVLTYTTGTTGRPKGVMLSHRNLGFVGVRNKRLGVMGPADVGLCLMPIAHSFGFAQMLASVNAATRLIIMPRFDLEPVLDLISSGTLTVFGAVPALYGKIVDVCQKSGRSLKPNALRFLLIGTAPLDLSLRRSIEELFGTVLTNGYGLTETSPTISRSTYTFGSDEIDLGAPISGVEVKIVDDDGNQVPRGEPGELWVRGPNVMLGYFGNPEATSAIFDEDGFMNTGDVVRQSGSGVLNIEGRTKELIIKSGFNVYPVEVEAQLNAHPEVLNSAVVGCERNGDEIVVGFIESAPGTNVDPGVVRSFVRERLAGYKVPSHIFVLDTLPYSPNAKILKKQLKDRAAALVQEVENQKVAT